MQNVAGSFAERAERGKSQNGNPPKIDRQEPGRKSGQKRDFGSKTMGLVAYAIKPIEYMGLVLPLAAGVAHGGRVYSCRGVESTRKQ